MIEDALHLAGVRYWSASVLPALVGTTLPLWLRPPGFAFRWAGAMEFLAATVLMHAGFSFLHARFERRTARGWTEARLLAAGLACIVLACALGLHLLRFTPNLILIAFGAAVLFAGFLYVVPPLNLSRRPGGEIVASMSLALLPVLGAYLIQTGDLTRPVYVAALPIYAATLLWVWTEQMSAPRTRDGVESDTLVKAFGPRVSGRVIVPGLAALLLATELIAVLSASVMPFAAAALILLVPVAKIVRVSWSAYGDGSEMLKASAIAMTVHSGLCVVLIASSLWAAGA